jgi:hypothetical protein
VAERGGGSVSGSGLQDIRSSWYVTDEVDERKPRQDLGNVVRRGWCLQLGAAEGGEL